MDNFPNIHLVKATDENVYNGFLAFGLAENKKQQKALSVKYKDIANYIKKRNF
jgi:hypothetical protein